MSGSIGKLPLEFLNRLRTAVALSCGYDTWWDFMVSGGDARNEPTVPMRATGQKTNPTMWAEKSSDGYAKVTGRDQGPDLDSYLEDKPRLKSVSRVEKHGADFEA